MVGDAVAVAVGMAGRVGGAAVANVAAGGRGSNKLVSQTRPATKSTMSEAPKRRFAVSLSWRRML
jgi:hypothetical protein